MNSVFTQFKYRFLYPNAIRASKNFGFREFDQTEGKDHVFIVTAGRSGSTLLAGLLNNFQEIHFPPEQFPLWFAITQFYALPWLSWNSFCNSLVDRMLSEHPNWGYAEADGLILRKQLHNLNGNQRTIGHVFQIFYRHHGEIHGKSGVRLIGDHSVIATNIFRTAYPDFPNSKFIFVVRHPYDVVASFLRYPELGYNVLEKAAWRWKNAIRAHDFLKESGMKLHVLRYEDLVKHTSQEMKAATEFLGITKSGIAKQNWSVVSNVLGVNESVHHQQLHHSVNTSQIGKWRTELNSQQLNTLHHLLASDAERFGYDLSL